MIKRAIFTTALSFLVCFWTASARKGIFPCRNNQSLVTCACEATCEKPDHIFCDQSTVNSSAGGTCQCDPGYVRRSTDKACVKPSDCPCEEETGTTTAIPQKQCGENEVFVECPGDCEPTCQAPHAVCSSTSPTPCRTTESTVINATTRCYTNCTEEGTCDTKCNTVGPAGAGGIANTICNTTCDAIENGTRTCLTECDTVSPITNATTNCQTECSRIGIGTAGQVQQGPNCQTTCDTTNTEPECTTKCSNADVSATNATTTCNTECRFTFATASGSDGGQGKCQCLPNHVRDEATGDCVKPTECDTNTDPKP